MVLAISGYTNTLLSSSLERPSPHRIHLSILQPREVCCRQAGQEGWRRNTGL